MTTTVPVNLGSRSYEIEIGRNIICQAASKVRPFLKGRQVFVISDKTVAQLHGSTLKNGLADLQQHWFIVPSGESSKSLHQFSQLVESILALSPERGDLVIAFGGGVIGDLAGYVAACVLRGLNFIQIPTTLLAQVDSSVGGKTGINSAHGKNLIGIFHQPRLVLIDLDVLNTLPDREMRAGYGEIVKYGLINQPDFFDWLEVNASNVLSRGSSVAEAVATSCAAKAEIVTNDEREAGQRALLNLGHTFAHAFESAGAYDGRILHGEAVSIGLVCAHSLSKQMGLSSGQDLDRVKRHLHAVGLPTDLSDFGNIHFSLNGLKTAMARDKKVKAGKIRFILTHGIGQAFVSEGVDTTSLDIVLNELLI